MIHYTVQQGSVEWHDLRGVIPTASNFDRLITPAQWQPTKGDTRKGYMLELLANRIFGISPEDQFTSAAMEHGREYEPIARAAYEFQFGVDIADPGFFTDDDRQYGASPDGLIGDDGLIEIKNPANAAVHLSSLIDGAEYDCKPADWTATVQKGAEITGFLRDHWIQVQGQLLVTGRRWCDLVSNFPNLPMVVVRVFPNPVFQALLAEALSSFCAELNLITDLAEARGWYVPKQTPVVEDGVHGFGVSDADVDDLIASGAIKPQEVS